MCKWGMGYILWLTFWVASSTMNSRSLLILLSTIAGAWKRSGIPKNKEENVFPKEKSPEIKRAAYQHILSLSKCRERLGTKKNALPTSHFGVIGRGFNMAAAEGVCPFPLPPSQYFKLYTDENVENKTAPDPPPTLKGTYSMFGASFEVNWRGLDK